MEREEEEEQEVKRERLSFIKETEQKEWRVSMDKERRT